jgi:lysine decarboxylase
MPTDPRGLRADAPLLDAWLRFRERPATPFTIPGHKQRSDLVGDVVAGDVPLYAGLDTMKLATGVLADAEARAARLWGADFCRFSTGGATHANQAVALAVAADGDTVIVSRTLHRSLLLGLVLAGLRPVWVRPEVDAATGLPLGVAPETVRRALVDHPQARAVFVGDPSYVGTVGDVAGLADAAHRHGVPLVVDAAWAAHFGFHPDLPRHPLQLGADVMVTSAHKTLPAWSQAALVLARTERLDTARLGAGVEASATTSPAGAILASTDAARALLERDGEELLGAAIAATRHARDRLQAVDGLVVLDGPAVDPLKLTLVLAGTGADGNAVEQDLLAAGLPVESADRDVLVAVVSLADTTDSLTALTDTLLRSLEHRRDTPRPAVGPAAYRVEPVAGMPPRDAFFAAAESAPLERAVGRISAELVAPYPPGIPVLAPGERITDSALQALDHARRAGVRIAYAADPTLATFRVTAREPSEPGMHRPEQG